MKKNLFKTQLLFVLLFLVSLQGCKWFEDPQGEVEVVSVHTAEDDVYRYCFVEVKISNIGKCDIYTSNISIQISSNKNTYYKSAELATTIAPGKCIFITIDFTIPLEKEDMQTVTTTTTTGTTIISDTSDITDSTSSSDTSSSSTSSNNSDSSSTSNSSSTIGASTTSVSAGTTSTSNSSTTAGNSNSNSSSTSTGTATTTGTSSSTRTSNSTNNSASTNETTTTSITTTTPIKNNPNKEIWKTDSVLIVDNFFD